MADRNSPFASKLRGLRGELDMSQKDLAKAIGKDVSTIQNWEAGVTMPTLATSINLARILGVTLDQLVGRSAEVTS